MSSPEVADVVRENASVDGVEGELPLFEPGGEGAKIRAVRTLGCLGDPAVLEEAGDRCRGAHEDMFALMPATPPEGALSCADTLRAVANRRTLGV